MFDSGNLQEIVLEFSSFWRFNIKVGSGSKKEEGRNEGSNEFIKGMLLTPRLPILSHPLGPE